VILGTGGLGRETIWAFDGRSDVRVRGFLTNAREEHGNEVCGLPVLGDESWLVDQPEVEVVCAIGDPRARRDLVGKLATQGVRFASAVHPNAVRSAFVELGSGCIVGASAVLTTQVRVGDHVVIGVGTVLSHDCVVEDFATLAPGCVLAGQTQIGELAELGTGVTLVPGSRVGRGALVGAQAAVVEDVPPNTVSAGVPARVLRTLPESERI